MSFAGTYLTRKQVCETLGVSNSTLRRLVDFDDFPQPIQISDRRQLFQRRDVVGWINSRRNDLAPTANEICNATVGKRGALWTTTPNAS